jgi:predicted esterase
VRPRLIAPRLLLVASLLVTAAAACGTGGGRSIAVSAPGPPADAARLHARPRPGVASSSAKGLRSLAHGALLYVPPSYRPGRASAFVLALHGAGSGPGGLVGLRPLAADAGLIVLAPKSRLGSWDVVRGGYGPDVGVIDDLLAFVFARYAVDPRRVFVWGFSDGASYALSLGLGNGDLFDAIVALSPGFAAPTTLRGKPRILVAHGTTDPVLPIDRTSRPLVRRLRDHGYAVTFRTFAGPHTLRPQVAKRAVTWLAAG